MNTPFLFASNPMPSVTSAAGGHSSMIPVNASCYAVSSLLRGVCYDRSGFIMPDILPRGRIELSVRRAPDGRCPELAAEVEPASLQPDSDIDLFLVVEPLPQVRFDRRREFEAVEARLASALAEARGSGVYTVLSPVIKTPEELCQGSFLHLDLVDQARILYDLQNILREHLADLAARLKAMGTQGVYKGGGYYWVLKLDYRWGNRIEL